jgi:hypothetical protein
VRRCCSSGNQVEDRNGFLRIEYEGESSPGIYQVKAKFRGHDVTVHSEVSFNSEGHAVAFGALVAHLSFGFHPRASVCATSI